MTREEKVKFLLAQTCTLIEHRHTNHPDQGSYPDTFDRFYDFLEEQLDKRLSTPLDYPDRN